MLSIYRKHFSFSAISRDVGLPNAIKSGDLKLFRFISVLKSTYTIFISVSDLKVSEHRGESHNKVVSKFRRLELLTFALLSSLKFFLTNCGG